jgi:hypothetical protein
VADREGVRSADLSGLHLANGVYIADLTVGGAAVCRGPVVIVR